MKKHTLKRYLASLLAVLMLISVAGVSPAVFADTPVLKASGQVLLTSSMSDAEVKAELANQLLENPGNVDASSLNWTYKCSVKGSYKIWGVSHDTLTAREATVSVFGETQTAQYSPTNMKPYYDATYTYPALKNNSNGVYTLYLNGQAISVEKVDRYKSNIEKVADTVSVPLTFLNASDIDYSVLDAAVFNAAVKSSTPNLTAGDVTVSYWARYATESDEQWMPLAGGTGYWNKLPLEYPAVKEGTYKVKVEYPTNAKYLGSSIELNVTFTGRQDASYTLKDSPSVGLKYTDATNIDYSTINADVFNAVFADITPQLSASDVTITYWASLKTGSLTEVDKDWMPLTGGKKTVGIDYEYAAVTEGTHKVKIVWGGNANYNGFTVEREVTFTGRQDASYTLKDSPSVGLKYTDATNIDYSTINADVFNAVFADITPQLSASDVTITYLAELKTGSLTDIDKAWVSLSGDSTHKAVTEGAHKVKIVWGGNANYNGFTVEREVTFTGRDDVPAVSPTSFEVKAAFNDDQSIKYESVRQAIWAQIEDKLPDNITYDKVSFAFKYEFAIDYWLTFEGSAADADFDTAIFGDANPRLKLGENTIRVKWAGDSKYNPYEQYFTVNVVDGREATDISFKDSPKVKITYDDNVNIKLNELYAAIWENVVDSVTPAELDKNSISIKYYATAETGSLGELGHAWANLNGETIDALTYPAISDGSWKLRFEFAGNANYIGFSKEVTVEFIGRDPAFALKDGVADSVTEVSLKFADAENYNYEVTAQNIREALLDKLGDIDLSEVKVQYRPILTEVRDLDFTPSTAFGKAFGEGEFTVVLSWGGEKGTALYKPFSAEVKVKMVDNRIQSVVKYVENASITFNMVGDQMLQAIFNDVIDKAGSTLPEGLTYKDFTYEYKVITVYKAGDIELGQKEEWVPIVGDDGYPNMNADEENGQTIRISYKGNADYKGCANEGSVKVMKANVKVSVKRLTVMHVGDTELPDNFITLDPNDTRSIEVYTFFVGVNTNKEATVYLMLPESKTKLIEAISKAQEFLNISPTLKEQLNDGMTIGELRAALDSIVNSPALNNKLGQMAFDGFMKLMGYNFTYAQFKSLYDTMSQIASLADNLRLALGSPTHAGIYQAIAITVSDNYNRAYGTGTVLVLMTWKDVKLQKNSALGDNNTITVSQAEQLKADNNLCVLTRNGNELDGEYVGNIHYWFTGVNRIYARSEMPTTPGKYIVTASVRGGDYYATPKTFIFTITAD